MGIQFTISGGPSVTIEVTEVGKDLVFTVTVGTAAGQTADLRGLFFQVANESLLSTLKVTGNVTEARIARNGVIDLGQGANMSGAASPFDIGVEFGTSGIGKDDVKTASFTLSSTTGVDLPLSLVQGMQFGARLTSVGTDGGGARRVAKAGRHRACRAAGKHRPGGNDRHRHHRRRHRHYPAGSQPAGQ